jgi:hypothetical protein
MRAQTILPVLLVAFFPLAVRSASAQPDSSQFHYDLTGESRYETGCFGPCACPVIFTGPLKGTFDLKHTGFDGLYELYDVSNVRWTTPDSSRLVSIQGSGTYRVGGEVAIQQQLKLDLAIDGGRPLRFDSGLVSGGGTFPQITIDISLHQNTACHDTVMHVDAVDPVSAVGPGAGGPGVRLDQLSSNPFSSGVLLRLDLPRAAPVHLFVYDLQGRVVRTLSRAVWLPAGVQRFTWDGREENGLEAPSGVYFVGAEIEGRRVARRVVKVE